MKRGRSILDSSRGLLRNGGVKESECEWVWKAKMGVSRRYIFCRPAKNGGIACTVKWASQFVRVIFALLFYKGREIRADWLDSFLW